MKLLIFLFSTVAAFGQCSFPSSTFPIQMPGESAISVTMTTEAVCSTIAAILGTPASGTTPTTLTANATNSQTTFTVASATGVSTCMGILTGSELSVITGISGSGPFILTVTRHSVGTTAAAYSSGQAVSFTQFGSGGCFLSTAMAAGISSWMGAGAFPGPLVTAQKAAIATANASIASTIAAGVTHVP